MRLLIVGDSITEGNPGIGYVQLLETAFAESNIINLGMGGDTIQGIGKRTIAYLQKDKSFDAIIIEAGHNDIILPDFSRKSLLHKLIAFTLKMKGSIPAENAEAFEDKFLHAIQEIKMLLNVPVIITTLSCLNEDLRAETNQTRQLYNRIIKEIASKQNCILADVGHQFDEILQDSNCSYFMDDLFNIFKNKTKRTSILNKKKCLKLTIDGVHLNRRGAEIYKNVLASCINEAGIE